MLRTPAQETGNEFEYFVETSLRGFELLEYPLLNKNTAFTEEERSELGLLGLLPPQVDTLDIQVARAYEEYSLKENDLERHIFLRALQDNNEVLFYKLLDEHVSEMMPIVYTPVVGAACQKFSHIYRRPRGLFIPYPHRYQILQMLENAPRDTVEVIVVTDGERILGLGDQGAGGMGIPIGKLSLYTLCGGIDPATTLPVVLDAGTDNEEALADPLYIGWRHERIRGQEYDDFVEAFVQAVTHRWPNALLQWEDFAKNNAGRLLARYRDRLCNFNDDIQGTAGVTVAGLLAGVRTVGGRLSDQNLVILGGGTAGTGIAGLVVQAMIEEGTPRDVALSRIWLVGRHGLLHDRFPTIMDYQKPYLQKAERFAGWPIEGRDQPSLEQTVRHSGASILIGVSAQPGAFTEPVLRAMAANVPHPIIFPLSNPTSKCEAHPVDILRWTEGRALVCTGSPFADVEMDGRRYQIGQCNNSYIFPGVGLGIVASGAVRVTDSMFMAAARCLAEMAPSIQDRTKSLFPPLECIQDVSRQVALATGAEAQRVGVAPPTSPEELAMRIQQKMWKPCYPRLRKKLWPTWRD